jgi:bacterioferritin-associated ferredoxin
MEIEREYPRIAIRPACLRAADAGWQKPKGPEIRELITRCAMTMAEVEAFLGLSSKSGGRQIRRWISEESTIPYTAWALLCARAGLGQIWSSAGNT